MTTTTPTGAHPDLETVVHAVAKRSFATLATVSEAGRPHAAGVLYSAVDMVLYTSTMRDSRKARNIAHNPHVGVSVPIRRIPFGPPSTVQFQGTAEIFDQDDPALRDLVAAGHLGPITGHGELTLDGGCFVKITPGPRLLTYGLGMSLISLIRDPLNASGSVTLP